MSYQIGHILFTFNWPVSFVYDQNYDGFLVMVNKPLEIQQLTYPQKKNGRMTNSKKEIDLFDDIPF
jgi:hypothetical protein